MVFSLSHNFIRKLNNTKGSLLGLPGVLHNAPFISRRLIPVYNVLSKSQRKFHHSNTLVFCRKIFGAFPCSKPKKSAPNGVRILCFNWGVLTGKKLSILYIERKLATGRAVPKGLSLTDKLGYALSAATRRISTALRLRGWRRPPSAGSASLRRSGCGQRRSACRRTHGPSSFWGAGW